MGFHTECMANLDYSVAYIREKETEGRPQDLPEKLEAFHPPCVGGPEREREGGMGWLTAHKRERAAGCHGGTERAGIGALVASAPLFFLAGFVSLLGVPTSESCARADEAGLGYSTLGATS